MYVCMHTVISLLRDCPYGHTIGGLSKEVVSDDGEFSMGHTYVRIYICDQ